MKCSIGSNEIKCWGRAIHTLAMIGDNDIHFQFSAPRLTLSTFDSSLSVCATATFSRNFFHSYMYETEDEKLSCRVPAKCLLKPFRSMRFLTKGISMCGIQFQKERDTMEIMLTCKFGSRILYSISLTSEAECLQVDYDLNLLTNAITAHSKLIIASLSNFTHSKGTGDLTLKATATKLFFKNCMTDLVKKEGKVYTELSLNPVDFTEFAIEVDGELTFPLREFKTFSSFAETMKLPISIYFQTAAEPVVVMVRDEDGFYEASLTLATKTMKQGGSEQVSTITSGTISNFSSQNSLADNLNGLGEGDGNAEPLLPLHPPPSPAQGREEEEEAGGEEGRGRSRNESLTNLVRSGPPAKRMRSVFPNVRGSFNAREDIPGHNVVLLDPSDSESE